MHDTSIVFSTVIYKF